MEAFIRVVKRPASHATRHATRHGAMRHATPKAKAKEFSII